MHSRGHSKTDQLHLMDQPFPWWYPVGAQVASDGTHFRVWAPEHSSVQVFIQGGKELHHELERRDAGHFEGLALGVGDGARYGFLLDGEGPFPDPASRYQPDGAEQLSQVVDAARFHWTDQSWRGVRIEGQVMYEMHIGTFTTQGTYCAAAERFKELADLGITLLEIMPVSEFPGNFGWGYDGVDLFAPTRLYGTPDDLRRFVDQAHSVGLAVILDVVYNHVGPSANYLPKFSPCYFSKKHKTDWGEAINYDGDCSAPVREFFSSNAAYWIQEFHFDGLRLDATQNICDDSSDHILALIARKCRRASENREIILVAENEPQHARIIRCPEQGGYGLDALWNDDFHHTAIVAATGSREAYFFDYLGSAQEFVSAAKYGFLYQGQWYSWQKKRRGTLALDIKPSAIVNFLQNHDQISNFWRGLRLHLVTSSGRYRALTALLLLLPSTPLLFQGQEFAASAPFVFFADHEPALAKTVRRGRTEFLSQFRSFATAAAAPGLQCFDPADPKTFAQCKLDYAERETHKEAFQLHTDLLRLRREDPVLSRQSRHLDGAVLADETFVLRFFGDSVNGDRLLVVNLGRYLPFNPSPEPLLAPPESAEWRILWSSEDRQYGGDGTAALDSDLNWLIPPHCAVLLAPAPTPEASPR